MSIFEKPGIIVLENQPIDPTGKYEYKAILERSTFKGSEDKWVLKIVGIYPNGDSLTPGQWYLDTLLGFDDYGSGRSGDIIYIDFGQKWYVKGMTPVLKEAEEIIYGSEQNQLDEEFVDKYAHIPMHLRNWYQKPEAQRGYEPPKKAPRLKKKTPKVFSKMLELEGEIQDLQQEVKDLYRRNRELEGEREEFMSWISSEYDWNTLDLLNSGLSDKDKIQGMEEWNMKQDRKDKVIPNPKKLLDEYKAYYPDEDQDVDKEIDEIENRIKEKSKELSDMQDIYESLNESVVKRMNFKRFEEDILEPLAEQMEAEFIRGRVSRVASIGKKIIERYYALGHLTILVRDIKRIGMPGEDIEPWIVDPKKPTKGIRFGSDWGSYKEFKDKVRELLTSPE